MRGTGFASLGAVVAIGLLLSATALPAQGVEVRKRDASVSPNGEVRIAVHSIYGDDCKGTQKAKIRLTRAPANGTIALRHSLERANRPAERCHGRDVPGIGVFYKPKPGFSGKDRVVYERQTPAGKPVFSVDASISVR